MSIGNASDNVVAFSKVPSITAGGAKVANINENVPESTKMADNAPSRQEVDAKIAAASAQTRSDFEALRGEIRSEFASVRGEMQAGFNTLRADMHEMNAGISRWMLGTVLTIIGTMVIGLGGLTITLYNAVKPSAPATTQQQPIIINVPPAPPARSTSTP